MKRRHHSTGQYCPADTKFFVRRPGKRFNRPSEPKSEDVPSSAQSELCSAENEVTPSAASDSRSSREDSGKEIDSDGDDDDTASSNRANQPSFCSILFGGKTYRGELMFEGDSRGRRTKVYRADIEDEARLVIKDTYRRRNCPFREEDLLRHIHGDGDVPGFVRMHACEYVNADLDGEALHSNYEDDSRIQLRLALHDYGERLLKAKSLNDLLKAIYDALEVHRTIYVQRRVLHRDMSAYNILMYPQWAKVKDRKVLESAPPLIRDILDGLRPLEERIAECLVIDTDHAAFLDSDHIIEELARRTGTPMFIARSVCAGQYNMNLSSFPVPMPELHGEAYDLYVKAHGQERYDRYTDKSAATSHSGIPPNRRPKARPAFSHRPEHDVESVVWTMLWVLLRVRPETFDDEREWTSDRVAEIWTIFRHHDIRDNPAWVWETRQLIFNIDPENWPKYFPSEMSGVATMMSRILDQVAPEYAFWLTQPPEEHLHEAVQRLILQYLVDHRDKDTKLDPDNLRPTRSKLESRRRYN